MVTCYKDANCLYNCYNAMLHYVYILLNVPHVVIVTIS